MKPEKRARFKTSPQYQELKQEKDPFRRRVLFLAFFAEKLKENGADAILVGGQAIDLYTAGTFATSDIDLLVTSKGESERLLNRFGFGRENSGLWFNRDLNIVVQVMTELYSGDSTRIKKFKVKGFELKVAAPEDLIAGRLYSAKFWKGSAKRDLEQAISLLRIFANSTDKEYLDSLAKRDNTEDYLTQAREYALRL